MSSLSQKIGRVSHEDIVDETVAAESSLYLRIARFLHRIISRLVIAFCEKDLKSVDMNPSHLQSVNHDVEPPKVIVRMPINSLPRIELGYCAFILAGYIAQLYMGKHWRQSRRAGPGVMLSIRQPKASAKFKEGVISRKGELHVDLDALVRRYRRVTYVLSVISSHTMKHYYAIPADTALKRKLIEWFNPSFYVEDHPAMMLDGNGAYARLRCALKLWGSTTHVKFEPCMEGNQVTFSEPPPAGTQMDVTYTMEISE